MNKLLLTFTFILSQIMDVVSTHIAINDYFFIESNPMANTYFVTLGIEESMVVKIAITLMIVLIYWLSLKRWYWLRQTMEVVLHIGSIMTWMAVFINLGGIIVAISSG